jgi:transcription elongation factor Elf1
MKGNKSMSKTVGTAFCNECGQEVEVEIEDFGIGPYEFWGARGTHKDERAVCSICGEIIENDVAYFEPPEKERDDFDDEPIFTGDY